MQKASKESRRLRGERDVERWGRVVEEGERSVGDGQWNPDERTKVGALGSAGSGIIPLSFACCEGQRHADPQGIDG